MKDDINEVKAIVEHLFLGRITDDIFGMESMSKVIANVNSKLQP
jgi:hypothetical protein